MNKKIQLFLLPFAGGSSLSFIRLVKLLDPSIEAVTVEYAARGSRKNEPFIEKYEDFLSDIEIYISNYRVNDLPYAILGYSMGSILAFNICARKKLKSAPLYSFFCAEGSPMSTNLARQYGHLNDNEFIEKMIMLGGIDKRLLNNQSLLNSSLELVKKDYNILGQFVYKSERMQGNASIIYSPKDSTCINMSDWSKVIYGNVEYYELGDNHFFINQEYRQVAKIINEKVLSSI